jgi:hypothetical protein
MRFFSGKKDKEAMEKKARRNDKSQQRREEFTNSRRIHILFGSYERK